MNRVTYGPTLNPGQGVRKVATTTDPLSPQQMTRYSQAKPLYQAECGICFQLELAIGKTGGSQSPHFETRQLATWKAE